MDLDSYDRMGRLTQVTDAVGTRTFSFDANLNPDKEIINTSGNPQLYYREITRVYEPPPVLIPPPGLIVGRLKTLKVGVSGDEVPFRVDKFSGEMREQYDSEGYYSDFTIKDGYILEQRQYGDNKKEFSLGRMETQLMSSILKKI